MNILAIQTSTPASSVALGSDNALLAMALQVDRRGHVGFLGKAMDYCFQQVGWTPRELDAIVVDVGPGLFTGIRAGLASAQGVAHTGQCDVCRAVQRLCSSRPHRPSCMGMPRWCWRIFRSMRRRASSLESPRALRWPSRGWDRDGFIIA